MIEKKKIALGAAAALLTLGAGLGVATAASAATAPTPTPSASASADGTATDGATPDGAGKGWRGHRGVGADAAELASKLGVDEATVTEALEAFRDANKPTDTGATRERPDREARESAFAASLAQSLGLDQTTVQRALDEIQAERKAERIAALKTRLDDAVADGTLTQAEADGAAKAIEKGVIGGGRGWPADPS
ncbi:hypothetical protein [Sinomonas mesophila]|uniref:hypothetical protein n=1 Tax=Sinomonas mesophila TaxID=1531955 RepID=UPI000986778D|nr:hypothetical protein [Sinomonas mesophila]